MRLKLRAGDAHLSELCNTTRFVFIVGSGRCGTHFLSRVLNRDPSGLVLHEPDFTPDATWIPKMRVNRQLRRQYTNTFRKYSILCRVARDRPPIYSEVSGTLRYCIGELRSSFPGSTVLILVRDLRDIVRSVMARSHYTNDAAGAWAISPTPGEPYYEQWDAMPRFAKVCWWAQDAYEQILNQVGDCDIIKLEHAVDDWEYFRTAILNPTGLNVGFDDWVSAKSREPRNATHTHTFPHWTNWHSNQKRIFEEICGKLMTELGYN